MVAMGLVGCANTHRPSHNEKTFALAAIGSGPTSGPSAGITVTSGNIGGGGLNGAGRVKVVTNDFGNNYETEWRVIGESGPVHWHPSARPLTFGAPPENPADYLPVPLKIQLRSKKNNAVTFSANPVHVQVVGGVQARIFVEYN